MTREQFTDLCKRAGWTALQAFLALLVATGTDFTNIATVKAAVIAGIAAALSALKSGLIFTTENKTGEETGLL